jgi:EPS-associated MarR family transcriptional regulator
MSSFPKSSASDEIQFRVLRLLKENPQLTQREVAAALGVSLGKANFCIKALFERGLIKLNNFQSSRHKLAYSYLLTPAGIAEKSAITARFLKRKMQEYEHLRAEIELLQNEIAVHDNKSEARS